MSIIRTNTELLPVIDVGMYESNIDPRYIEERIVDIWLGGDQDLEPFISSTLNESSYETLVECEAESLLQSNVVPLLRPIGVKYIKSAGINSPREYNFSTDVLLLDITVDIDVFNSKYETLINQWQYNKNVTDFINENYKSRSGFISFMPESLNEMRVSDDFERCFSMFCTLFLVANGEQLSIQAVNDTLYDNIIEGAWDCFDIQWYGKENGQEWCQLLENNRGMFDILYWNAFEKFGHIWKRYTPQQLETNGSKATSGYYENV